MGFAKYHEDNMEMWIERNRDRDRPRANTASTSFGKTAYGQNSNTCISGQSSTRPLQFNNVARSAMAKAV